MSQLKNKPFQLSFLAAAILSLSACSSAPKIAGIDLGEVGSGIGKVGSKTMELGSNAWEGTKNLLHIGPVEPDLLDEVDLALMEDDSDMEAIQLASNDTQLLLPQGDQQPMASDALNDNALLPDNSIQTAKKAFGQVPEQPAASGKIALGEQPEQTSDIVLSDDEILAFGTEVQADGSTVPRDDLTHTVMENETLWVIAKRTTGDANNWHVIADINNLAPNASVYVGQKITIPADMVKPVETESIAEAQTDTEQPALKAAQPAAVALTIPAKKTSDDSVIATAEQLKPEAPADMSNIMADATALKVGPGETLWDFAKRTTGDATNWKMIADKNLLDEQQLKTIRPGQQIYVPTDIVRSRDANGVLIAKGAEGTVPTATVGGAMPKNKEAIDASTAVLAGTNQPEGEIKIVEAAFQDNKGITPVTAESLSQEAAVAVAENESKLGKVMVSGTYYPKAVYNEADFSSSLLMRVSPGTQLLVSKAIGPWLEVKTDKGVGYVHSRDIK